jgi:spermidine synthase
MSTGRPPAGPDTAAGTGPDATTEPGDGRPLDPRARRRRFLVLLAVFACAACGLVYELALVAQGAYLLGNSVTQASVVLSVMVFAMGIGSLAAKPLLRSPALAFGALEALLALVGGLSVLALYAAFAWLDLYRPGVIVAAVSIGILVGAEIPLLTALLQRIRRQDAERAVADLFAVDYLGALVGGLAFPFLLLPLLGQIRGALAVGVVNALAGVGVVLGVFRDQVTPAARRALGVGLVAVVAVLATAFALATRFETTARQQLYADPVVLAERSAYQEIVLTESVSLRGQRDLRLFLDGDLQFSSVDEYRYHEALVRPALAGPSGSVLVLGGGDGLAMREVLKHPGVRRAVEVELDPQVLDLARTDDRLRRLNEDSLRDPRVEVVTADAFSWLRGARERFDAIVVDMPDPDNAAVAKLYSVEFYSMARRTLAPGGRMVVQAGSPYFAPQAFSCVLATVAAAGLRTLPYHVDVPTFGDWGFVLAGPVTPVLGLDPRAPAPRSLDAATLAAARAFPPDRAPTGQRPSTLDDPRITRYAQQWRD